MSDAMDRRTEPVRTFRITGMNCADCAKTIERGVSRLEGVTTCTVNFGAALLKVEGRASREAVVRRVRELGYDVEIENEKLKIEQSRFPRRFLNSQSSILNFLGFLLSRRDTTLAVIGALLILPGLIFHELLPFLGVESTLFDITSIGALVIAGYSIARSAWRSVVINHQININALMTIAALGAIVIGAYTEAGLVMVLFAIGEALEGYTTERARRSIRSLMAIAPNEATLLTPNTAGRATQDESPPDHHSSSAWRERRVPVSDLRIGDLILVKPGERIPMDGRVVNGVSLVNQAPITGESVPVEKQSGDDVFAGSINGEGALDIEVTRRAEDNTLSRIIRMVEEAQEHKAPAERFVDRFAQYYTPTVVAIAGLVAIVPPLVFGAPFMPAANDQGWLYRALELLVVACPCALVISTPVAIISAITRSARDGVLIKGGAYLEALSAVQVVAFDKTGTLTEGTPSVIKVRSVGCTNPATGNCEHCADLLALAGAVERRSEHPLARAVNAAAEQSGLSAKYAAADSVRAMAGQGVVGTVNGREVVVASHGYFDQAVPHDAALCAEIHAAAALGQTPMLIGVDGKCMGYITAADTVREGSAQAIAELKALGIRTVMLTGDNAVVARTIAAQIGVDEIRADLLPGDKLRYVQSAGSPPRSQIAMVGDGVNDAPALAAADVGIAMGAGTAQAMETADVVLMGDDLRKLPSAIKLGRAAMNAIRANIAFTIGVKLIVLVLVLLGLGTMWLAVLADVGASLLVTLNGMRLLRFGARRTRPA